MPGFPVHHQLLELAQTHVHQVSDAIRPSYPLSSPSPPAFNLSQYQGLFQWVSSCIRWPKYWSFSFSISPSNEYLGLISFKTDWVCCRKGDPFQGLKLGSCLTLGMNCLRRPMCGQSKRFYWERAPGWRVVGEGNLGQLLCHVAHCLGLYDDRISFWVVFSQSF